MNSRTSILLIAATLLLGIGGLWFNTRRSANALVPGAASTPAASVAQTSASSVLAHSEVSELDQRTATPVRKVVGTRTATMARTNTSVQGTHHLTVQRFSVNAQRDTLLRTDGGCTVRVPANCFMDVSGKAVSGPVTVLVQEALTPTDLLLGGLATVYQGEALESGGSFCIMASARGQVLQLANDMALDMAVPTRMKKAGMQFFPGEVQQGQVVWQQPEPLEAPEVQHEAIGFWLEDVTDTLTTNVTYTVEGFEDPQDAPVEVTDRVSEVAWANGGLILKRDSSFTVGKHRVHFYANETPTNKAVVPLWQVRTNGQAATVVGTNTFQEDPAVNYVFRVKRLGWANIDRLLNDKRTRPVDMITTVADTTDLQDVRISLVMKSHNLYLPGYQRADGGYGFSHGDFERMQLPVGANALLVATGQRHGKPWYAMQPVVIAPTAHVELHLKPTTDAELKAALMEAL